MAATTQRIKTDNQMRTHRLNQVKSACSRGKVITFIRIGSASDSKCPKLLKQVRSAELTPNGDLVAAWVSNSSLSSFVAFDHPDYGVYETSLEHALIERRI